MKKRPSITEIMWADRGHRIYEHYGFEPSKKPIKSPFREEERTPSFYIVPEGFFIDFGNLEIKGHAIHFIMRWEKCDFKTACKIAERIYQAKGGQPLPITPRRWPQQAAGKPITFIPTNALENAIKASEGRYSGCRFLIGLSNVWKFGRSEIAQVVSDYRLYVSGARWPKAVGFPYIDVKGKVRELKIMDYHPENCKRVKEPAPRVCFMGKRIVGENANLRKCLFGEHLLSRYPEKPVAIVESEKTAIVSSIYYPQYVWLATGGATGWKLGSLNDCEALAGRTVTFFPDLSKSTDTKSTFTQWKELAAKLASLLNGTGTTVKTSRLLEKLATAELRAIGGDLADYLAGKPFPPLAGGKGLAGEFFPAPTKGAGTERPEAKPIKAARIERPRKRNSPDWGNDIAELEAYFKSIELPPHPVKLDRCSTIKDSPLFIESHLATVKANNGNRAFLPYLNRLKELKQVLTANPRQHGSNPV